jgi:hypothetical protein
MKPLSLPRNNLGECMESAFEGRFAGAEKNVKQFGDRFRAIAKDAFGNSINLGTPIPAISNERTIAPWQHQHARGDDETIIVTSPVRWIVSYRGEYGLRGFMDQRLSGDSLNEGSIEKLFVRNLTLCTLLEEAPDLHQLMQGLCLPR